MTEYFQKNLFYNISLEEYKHLLGCLNAREKHFTGGETVCSYDQAFTASASWARAALWWSATRSTAPAPF